jgi:hypothetical protein
MVREGGGVETDGFSGHGTEDAKPSYPICGTLLSKNQLLTYIELLCRHSQALAVPLRMKFL